MCEECYSDNSRATPLKNPIDCLSNHTQYICGTCGRMICIQHDNKRGLMRWNFPFTSLLNAKLYLRVADYSVKKPCGIYEIISDTGRISYKIFADLLDLKLFLKNNRNKTCKKTSPIFRVEKYSEFPNTKVKKLSAKEAKKYISK